MPVDKSRLVANNFQTLCRRHSIMSPDEKAWQDIRLRIVAAAKSAHRDPASIRVLAVSKSFPIQTVRNAYALGQRAFGENYVQEAIAKIDALAGLPGIEWHLIGPLQSNKARAAVESFAWVETIDRQQIAQRLRRRAAPSCLRSTYASRSTSAARPRSTGLFHRWRCRWRAKYGGCRDSRCADSWVLRKLPTTAARVRAQFHLLRELYDAGRGEGLALDTLSMGMSSDFELAIAEGATQLRIGSALFGPRGPDGASELH